MDFRHKFKRRPPFIPSGGIAFALPRRMIEANAEEAIAVSFVTHRRLFGYSYSLLLPRYFHEMPERSGVFILLFSQTKAFAPGAVRPGDVDLLAVPYEGDELVLDQTLAVELKVVRASYGRQGKSPNEFGFSQASALWDLGFPYVAVGHLIVSDQSPSDAWQETMTFEVIDAEGNVRERQSQIVDRLPWMLTDRNYGRLAKACPREEFGLLSAFVRHSDIALAAKSKAHLWYPAGRPASRNPGHSPAVLENVATLFDAHPERWFDNPRYDPPVMPAAPYFE